MNMSDNPDSMGPLGPRADRPDGNLIGLHLVELAYLDVNDIPSVTAAQAKWKVRFGEAAVRMGLVSRDHLREALSRQVDFPFQALPAVDFPAELVMVVNPHHRMAEQLRSLRTQLALRWLNLPGCRKCVSVVSTRRREGRSFIAANLAVAFAQMNERTLLVDMDLRQPRQHEIFRIGNLQGLSNVLYGHQGPGPIPGVQAYQMLTVLPAGPLPANPQELLAPRMLSLLFDHLRASYDVIVIDTPAWSDGADAQIIGAQAGSALLVSQPRQADQKTTRQLVASLRDVGASVLGAVMNQA